MLILLRIALFATSSQSLLHHLIVGTINGQALYSLEMDDQARTVHYIQARDASGASPSLVLDHSKKHLFSSRPANGTLTRYSIEADYQLVDEGTMDIPASCNTTIFKSLQLTSASKNSGIWGTASTGTCSVLFGLTTDGYTQLHSKEIAGDIHSLAWGVNSHNLHALDSHSSSSAATSIVNFRISDDPSLEDIVATDILANVTDASQIVSHPTGNRIYVVTKGTNELISIVLQQDTNTVKIAEAPSRYRILPSSLDTNQFHTSSLALTASKNTLWTFSQSSNQAVITAFTLNPTTGEVIDAVARASWAGAGEGQFTAAPFESGDIVAITNSPNGYITLLGLDNGVSTTAEIRETLIGHEFLEQLGTAKERDVDVSSVAARIKSYGRSALDEIVALGESAWID